MSVKTDEYRMMKHFLLYSSTVTHTSSSRCNESWANAYCWNIFFFLVKIQVQGVMDSVPDEYWGMTVLHFLYIHIYYWTQFANILLKIFDICVHEGL